MLRPVTSGPGLVSSPSAELGSALAQTQLAAVTKLDYHTLKVSLLENNLLTTFNNNWKDILSSNIIKDNNFQINIENK